LQHVSRLGKERDSVKKKKEEVEDRAIELDQSLKRLQTISKTSQSTFNFGGGPSLSSELQHFDKELLEEAKHKFESIPDKVKRKMKDKLLSKSKEKGRRREEEKKEVKNNNNNNNQKKNKESTILQRPEMFRFKNLTLDDTLVNEEASNNQSGVVD